MGEGIHWTGIEYQFTSMNRTYRKYHLAERFILPRKRCDQLVLSFRLSVGQDIPAKTGILDDGEFYVITLH